MSGHVGLLTKKDGHTFYTLCTPAGRWKVQLRKTHDRPGDVLAVNTVTYSGVVAFLRVFGPATNAHGAATSS